MARKLSTGLSRDRGNSRREARPRGERHRDHHDASSRSDQLPRTKPEGAPSSTLHPWFEPAP